MADANAARAAGEACRPDCREAHRNARRACQSEARTCTETCRGPVDEACAEQCSIEFQPCAEDLGICRDGCREERRAGYVACRETSTGRGEFRDCVRGVHTQARECNIDCHDSMLCGERVHECLDSCRIDESTAHEHGAQRPHFPSGFCPEVSRRREISSDTCSNYDRSSI